jgi:hypothetical protein
MRIHLIDINKMGYEIFQFDETLFNGQDSN